MVCSVNPMQSPKIKGLIERFIWLKIAAIFAVPCLTVRKWSLRALGVVFMLIIFFARWAGMAREYFFICVIPANGGVGQVVYFVNFVAIIFSI